MIERRVSLGDMDYIEGHRDFQAEGCGEYIAELAKSSLGYALAKFINSGEQEQTIIFTVHLRRTEYGGIEVR